MTNDTAPVTAEDVVAELSERLGTVSEPSEWYTVTQEDVNTFGVVTGDEQWIHMDVERAADGPFGGTIAHGFYTLSLIPRLLNTMSDGGLRPSVPVKMGVNYGLNRVRFPSVVPVGKRVRATRKLVTVEAVASDCLHMVNEVTIHVEGGSKPACIAESVGRMYV